MNKFKKYAPRVVTLIVIALIAWYFSKNQNAFKELANIPLYLLVLLIILKVVRIFNSGQFTQATLEAYSNKIPAREGFYIALISSMGNFFGPFLGGASVRAVYLKQKYKFSYSDFASALSGFYFITFIVYSFIGLLSLVVIHAEFGEYSYLAYLFFAGWFVTTLYMARVKSINWIVKKFEGKSKYSDRMLRQVNQVIKGWHIIKGDKKLYHRLVRLTFVAFLISLLVALVEFKAVGANWSLASLSLYVALAAVSLLVSVTPSAIGIREAIFIFSGNLLGLSNKQIIQIALIDRGATFAVMGVSYILIKSHGGFKQVATKAKAKKAA